MKLLLLALVGCSGPQEEPAWMATLADSSILTELSIPGTHDSGALFEPYPALAKAQSLTIADQLTAGIRYFDVRCRNFDDQFLIYHGAIDQNQSFDQVLATMFAFLDAHPTETLIVSVKEELMEQGATLTFEQVFDGYIATAPERWYLDATVPTLGDARGKLVLLRRFDITATTPLGIDASPWADNATFSIANDAMLQIEDNYIVTDNDDKWTAITTNLTGATAGDPTMLFLTYTSGYQTIAGLPNITSVSDDINQRLDTWLADPANKHAHTGVVVMDYVTESRNRAIITTNM